MTTSLQFWRDLEIDALFDPQAEGLVKVEGFERRKLRPEMVLVMEKARHYGADHVFFEASALGKPPVAQAFVYVSSGPENSPEFGARHRQLWSWGGVPLVYRKLPGVVQLFRCAHRPDFLSSDGEVICKPAKTLRLAGKVAQALEDDLAGEPWWDLARLRNGTLWQDPHACTELISDKKTAHKQLIDAVRQLRDELNQEGVLPREMRRKLLILSLLIEYLKQRRAFPDDYFSRFREGATEFFEVLADGKGLVALLADLEGRFNGSVFALKADERDLLETSQQLGRFARLIEGRQEKGGQRSLWRLYSFEDLPVELISQIYQLFVQNADSSVYTPRFLVRLMLEEALDWKRLDRLERADEVILDPSCGSGVFLVEAYKRLVAHWRSRNEWKHPSAKVLRGLLRRVRGVDLEPGAVELAAFSLYLALCDALEPAALRQSHRLFPLLIGKTLHEGCFFSARRDGRLPSNVGVIVGNPPFESKLTTPGAHASRDQYEQEHGAGSLPDTQVAYLFLHESMGCLVKGGVLCLLQQYNFLYNQQSLGFRQRFLSRWDVREILDFISVRGLFQKGGADTKIVVVVAEATKPPANRRILHATFRRSARLANGQGFEIDAYDLHWLPRELALTNDGVWRADLLGGGRMLALSDRLKTFRTLEQYATEMGWDFGEGFVEGSQGISRPAAHIVGKKLLPSEALSADGIDERAIVVAPDKPIEGPRSPKRFTPPMLLVREQMDLPLRFWSKHYLTYKNQIVGFAAPPEHKEQLIELTSWLTANARTLRSFVALTSVKLFTQKATTLSGVDIWKLPFPANHTLQISANEQLLIDDIVDHLRDYVRLGEDSAIMQESGHDQLPAFDEVLCRQINTVYRRTPLRALPAETWPGIICQPFVFGTGRVDWEGRDQLRDKLESLLRERRSASLAVTRVARIYDGRFIFLIKPDRMRFWLRSVALRDADDVLADLRQQGF